MEKDFRMLNLAVPADQIGDTMDAPRKARQAKKYI